MTLSQPFHNARFLAIDDQESNLFLLERLLKQVGVTQVYTLSDSRDALACVEEVQPDCILLDMQMPHVSGLEVLQQIRARAPSDIFLPVVMLTASLDERVKHNALMAGASGFLIRPVNRSELLLHLSNLLQTRELTRKLQEQKDTLEGRVLERTKTLRREREEAKRSAERFEALADLSARIAELDDPNDVAREGLALLGSLTGLEIGVMFCVVEEGVGERLEVGFLTGELPAAARPLLTPRPIQQAGGILKRILDSNGAVVVNDYGAWSEAPFASLGLKTVMGVPIMTNGRLHSLLFLGSFQQTLSNDGAWPPLLSAVARRVERALERTQMIAALRHTEQEALRVVGLTLEYRDYETKGHTDRVTQLALQLGEALGLSDARLRDLRWGSYLHDTGKVAIPDQILLKPGRLSEEEFGVIQRHVTMGEAMLRHLSFLPPEVFTIIRHHHERWDGSGYPDGLAGEAIPLLARLFAVCDVYDALTSERPYKRAWTHQEAVEELHKQKGKQFDPRLVEAFVAVLEREPRFRDPVNV